MKKMLTWAAVVALMLCGSMVSAQKSDRFRIPEEDLMPRFELGETAATAVQDDIDNDKPFFDLASPGLAELSAGWGSQFAEEEETFSRDAQYAVVHVDILGVDLFDATSGLGAQFAFGGELEYTVWSLNRATVPGTDKRMYAGSDLKLIQSADDGGAEGDFDLRIVSGYRLAEVGPGLLSIELYFLEENTPIGFALLYGFN